MNILNKGRSLGLLCNRGVEAVQIRFYEKLPYTRRFGYKEKIITEGLLPRSKDFKPVEMMPTHKVKNSFSQRRALFGQNDYIDILGDGSIHPTKLMSNVPYWLRGFKGNELKMSMRQMKFFGEHYSHVKPEKFYNLRRRMTYLYRYFNRLRQD
ncbi:39S ribosomal protein L51, mitochondrial [Chamberlinius hualienensis]